MLCTHGVCINDYDYNLTTVMVLDDFQEGIPVLWALSNREDKTVVYILQALKMWPTVHRLVHV